MIALPDTLRAWGTEAFAATLKAELEALNATDLPLDAAATPGCHVDDKPVNVTVIRADADAQGVHARVGAFFTEIVASCGCGDDPFEQYAYCELDIVIDKATARALFSVIQQG